MTSRQIETSDRGITITKSLAWTLATGLIAGGIWLGSNVASLITKMDEFSAVAYSAALERKEVEVRVRGLEVRDARAQEQYLSILAILSRIDNKFTQLEKVIGNED